MWESERIYLVSSFRKVIRSLLSFAFFNPPKAILVPGMYFFGFSRYSNCPLVSQKSSVILNWNDSHTKVFSSHTMAFCLFASV